MYAGVMVDLLTANTTDIARVDAYRIIFLAYGFLALILAGLSFFLSSACEGAMWRGARQVGTRSCDGSHGMHLSVSCNALDFIQGTLVELVWVGVQE